MVDFDSIDVFIDCNGWVDYGSLLKVRGTALLPNIQRIGAVRLADLEAAGPDTLLAFLLDAYNLLSLNHMCELLDVNPNYDNRGLGAKIKFFFTHKVTVGGQRMSLYKLEGKIRKFGDPRIHFYLNCASRSCPRLRKGFVTAKTLNSVLDESTRDFINRQGGVEYTAREYKAAHLRVSSIFKWYRKDLPHGDICAFVRRFYDRGELTPPMKVKYLKYDWSKNDLPTS